VSSETSGSEAIEEATEVVRETAREMRTTVGRMRARSTHRRSAWPRRGKTRSCCPSATCC